MMGWGARTSEHHRALPGDDILVGADVQVTRAITIRAQPQDVWPWIAQLGRKHAGFYSYTWLENLAGCRVQNADRIVSDWQRLSPGDAVDLSPALALTADYVEPGRALVLHARAHPDDTSAGPPFDFTWSFVLEPEDDTSTRLIVRERYEYLSGSAGFIVRPMSAVSLLMTQKMLRGIKARAERARART